MIARKARPGDAGAMADVLADMLAVGGITAQQSPLTVTELRQPYLDGPDGPALRDGRVVGRVDRWFSLV